jgi:hypothetical protein
MVEAIFLWYKMVMNVNNKSNEVQFVTFFKIYSF